MDIETLDALIFIFFSLFVASTINERIIDFIKVQFPRPWMKHFNFYDEIRRRRRLWLLAFCLSFLSVWLADINLFELILKNRDGLGDIAGFFDNYLEIGEHFEQGQEFKIADNKEWQYYSLLAAGYILTAIFVSLGAKFWHDILDLTLAVKRARTKLTSFDPKTVQEIDQIDKYLQENEYQIALKALEAHRQRLEAIYQTEANKMVVDIGIGYEFIDDQYRLCVQVFDRSKASKDQPLDEKKIGMLPRIGQRLDRKWKHLQGKLKEVTYVTNYGYVFRFPVISYYPGIARTTNGEKVSAGGALFNNSTQNNAGTFGCLVKKRFKMISFGQ